MGGNGKPQETRRSIPQILHTGVAQGSVLSPTLVVIFINALLRMVTATRVSHRLEGIDDFNHVAFAEEISVVAGSQKDTQKLVNAIRKFQEWCGMKINLNKTSSWASTTVGVRSGSLSLSCSARTRSKASNQQKLCDTLECGAMLVETKHHRSHATEATRRRGHYHPGTLGTGLYQTQQ
jgi:hypothetical protein